MEPVKVKISDGTEVLIRAPGIGYEIEAFGAIPNLAELVRQSRRGDDSGELELGDEMRATLLAIVHAAIEPRFSIDGRPGTRDARDLLPPDVGVLGAAVLELRRRAMAEAEAALRPTPAEAK